MVLKGFRVDELRTLVAGAMEPVLKPLVYSGPLELVGAPPRARRARLHRLGHAAGDRRGARARARLRRRGRLDLRDRRRRLHRPLAPRVPRRRQGGGDPRARRAGGLRPRRVDRVLGQPHRPAVPRGGRAIRSPSIPTASCAGSPPSAAGRCSSSATCAYPPDVRRLHPALLGLPLVLGAGAAVWAARDAVQPEEARARLAALGFAADDVETLVRPLRRRRAARQARPRPRADRVAGDAELRPACASREDASHSRDSTAGSRRARSATSCSRRSAPSSPRPSRGRSRVVAADAFPTGHLGYWVRWLAEAGLVALMTASSPARLAHPDGGEPLVGTNPLAIGLPNPEGAPVVVDVSMAQGDLRRRDRGPGATRGRSSPSAATRPTRRSRSRVGLEGLIQSFVGAEPRDRARRGEAGVRPLRRGSSRAAAGLRLPGDS